MWKSSKNRREIWSVIFERKRDLFSKRLARILYLCFCARIAMKTTFEFGFKESNLMRRSFHGGAMISTLWENAFLEGMTHKTKAKILKFVKIFICGFASFVKLVRGWNNVCLNSSAAMKWSSHKVAFQEQTQNEISSRFSCRNKEKGFQQVS